MENKKLSNLSTLDKASAILILMLLLCLLPMPYGFYLLVRFYSFIVFSCIGYNYYISKKSNLALFFFSMALLFQPFLKVALGRPIWNIIDILMAVIIAIILYQKNQ